MNSATPPKTGAPSSYWLSSLGATQEYVDVAGTRTRVLHAGDGPALILLHGMGGHLENFVTNVLPLSQALNMHVYAIDMMGHGMNSRPESFTFDDMVDHVVRFMDTMGIKKASFAGLSLGGLVAPWIALRHPGRVDRLVLVTNFGMYIGESAEAEAEKRFAYLRDSNKRFMKAPTLEMMRERMMPMMHDPAAMPEEMIRARLHIYQRPGAERAMVAFVENFYETRQRHILSAERLSQISVPTLVVWGEFNNPPVAYARQAAAQIPNSSFHVCANSGHWPHFEASEDFNRVVADFLR